MNEALKTQLKILKLSDINQTFQNSHGYMTWIAELPKSIMMDTKEKLLTGINQTSWISTTISSIKSFLSKVLMSELCKSSFFPSGIRILVHIQTLINI